MVEDTTTIPQPAVIGPLIQIGDPTDGAVLIPAHEAGGNQIIFQTKGLDRVVDLSTGNLTETEWKYSTTITMADPNNGFFRANSLTGALVTQLAISKIANTGIDRGQLLASLIAGDTINIQDLDDATSWIRFSVSATPTNNTTWFLVPVTFVVTSGVAVTNNNRCILVFSQTGLPSGGSYMPIGGTPSDVTFGTVYIGSKARLVPLANGVKLEIYDGATWQTQAQWTE